jgi:hypothetical protein
MVSIRRVDVALPSRYGMVPSCERGPILSNGSSQTGLFGTKNDTTIIVSQHMIVHADTRSYHPYALAFEAFSKQSQFACQLIPVANEREEKLTR